MGTLPMDLIRHEILPLKYENFKYRVLREGLTVIAKFVSRHYHYWSIRKKVNLADFLKDRLNHQTLFSNGWKSEIACKIIFTQFPKIQLKRKGKWYFSFARLPYNMTEEVNDSLPFHLSPCQVNRVGYYLD